MELILLKYRPNSKLLGKSRKYCLKYNEKKIIFHSSLNLEKRKCHNCGYAYLLKANGELDIRVRRSKGIILINQNYEKKWFHNKQCRNSWIFKLQNQE